MSIYESGEMYLESILVLRGEKGLVRSIDIANYTGYAKPSISRAVGILKQNGYIEVDAEGFVTLTNDGEAIAKDIYEKHIVLTKYLVSLGVSPETAKEDACKMEHVISKETFEKIKQNTND